MRMKMTMLMMVTTLDIGSRMVEALLMKMKVAWMKNKRARVAWIPVL
jgi:cell division ATPase FtsA